MPKHYYQIGEVANMLGVRKHTLRYWESEFPKLNPRKNSSGKRSYTQHDIEVLKKIKYLLYDQNYSIEGARKKMSSPDAVEITEEVTIFGRPHEETKLKIREKLERIQDSISLSPSAKDSVQKKREIREMISSIRELLSRKDTDIVVEGEQLEE